MVPDGVEPCCSTYEPGLGSKNIRQTVARLQHRPAGPRIIAGQRQPAAGVDRRASRALAQPACGNSPGWDRSSARISAGLVHATGPAARRRRVDVHLTRRARGGSASFQHPVKAAMVRWLVWVDQLQPRAGAGTEVAEDLSPRRPRAGLWWAAADDHAARRLRRRPDRRPAAHSRRPPAAKLSLGATSWVSRAGST